MSTIFRKRQTTIKTIFILTLLYFQANGQSKKIDSYIKQLDDSVFHIQMGYVTHFQLDNCPAYSKLINIGKPATEKLITALYDTTKVIMSHLTLCMIWLKHAGFGGPNMIKLSWTYIAKYHLGDDYESASNLYISRIDNRPKFYRRYVDSLDLVSVIKYWRQKTSKKSTNK